MIEVLSNEQYNENWYIDSFCSHHMNERKECLRDFRKLTNVGVVKFMNNTKCTIKEYGKITNGSFTVNRVAYVEGLKHNLIRMCLAQNVWEPLLLAFEKNTQV